MKTITGFALSALLLLGPAQAFAQSAVWTGDYYVVVGLNEKLEYAVTYGYHAKWHDIKAGPNFEGGTLAALALAPSTDLSDTRLPGRYELLAIGNEGDRAYAVVGYEWVSEPRFAEGMDPLADLTSAADATWTGATYVVLGRAMGGDGVLPTPRDAVAFGRPGAWQTAYLPFNDEYTFTAIAAAPFVPAGPYRPDEAKPVFPNELLVVGTDQHGAAVAMTGYQAGAAVVFTGTVLPIPEIMHPLAVEWTGTDYVVVGDRGDGQFGVMVGAPGRWSRADDFTLDGGKFTALAVVPLAEDVGPRYQLLAVGSLKAMAVSLPGHEEGGLPVFEHGCVRIPDLWGTAPETSMPVQALGSPEAGVLSAPYPNPAAARAAFTVTVAEDQPVRVSVFDALGREVALLHDGALAAGPAHAFTFDGAALASGSYLVRVQGAGFARTRTVVLTR